MRYKTNTITSALVRHITTTCHRTCTAGTIRANNADRSVSAAQHQTTRRNTARNTVTHREEGKNNDKNYTLLHYLCRNEGAGSARNRKKKKINVLVLFTPSPHPKTDVVTLHERQSPVDQGSSTKIRDFCLNKTDHSENCGDPFSSL